MTELTRSHAYKGILATEKVIRTDGMDAFLAVVKPEVIDDPDHPRPHIDFNSFSAGEPFHDFEDSLLYTDYWPHSTRAEKWEGDYDMSAMLWLQYALQPTLGERTLVVEGLERYYPRSTYETYQMSERGAIARNGSLLVAFASSKGQQFDQIAASAFVAGIEQAQQLDR